MLFVLFLTLAAVGGAAAGFYGGRRHWKTHTLQAVIALAEEMAYAQSADDALTVVEVTQ